MKTAISIPDETFEAATRQPRALGMSRSEFFSRAARRYLRDLEASSLTAQINEAVQSIGNDDSVALAVEDGRRRLRSSDDSW